LNKESLENDKLKLDIEIKNRMISDYMNRVALKDKEIEESQK
jgi:hypothetical protein